MPNANRNRKSAAKNTVPARRPAPGSVPGTPSAAPKTSASAPETVDPRWLLQAIAAVVALGLFCAYLSVCGLFYTQQWQFVLHPTRAVTRTPASIGLSFQPVQFGVDLAGKPQLAGWWIPGDSPADPTVLMLHGQDGSMSDALPAVKPLHDARLNVLLFDYRGYGQSGGRHPSEQLMRADATAALAYLTQTRGIPTPSILVYGAGLGASLAVSLCDQHPAVAGLILQSADGDTESRVLSDARAHIVPVSLLFHNRFPLADPLHRLKSPKLILSDTEGSAPVDAKRAADPKMTAELPRDASQAEVTAIIWRFLDTYVLRPPQPAAHG